MKPIQNESGATLVLTLGIITIVLLCIMALFSQLANTTQQINKTEQITMSEQIAAMGVDYYRAYTEDHMPRELESNEAIALPDFPLLEKFILDDGQGNVSFWIKSHSLQELSESEMMIHFTSVGQAFGEITETESSIKITIESGE
ncbi:hypothetical protein [Ornithinibacillus contaminans]|uniref:hypothetical protein n=1 Tax=Ornithinibacillus contaminans TaxID=694055 RepID=UPI00064D9711|nr:hypothetical protein [Ornithinibacillus contaminans]